MLVLRLHPAISITLGIITPILIFGYLILKLPLDATSENMDIIIPFTIIFGGFIATYLTAEKRIIYSFGVGITISIIVLILGLGTYKGYNDMEFLFIFYSLIAGIGGFFGKNIEEIDRKISRVKYKTARSINSKIERLNLSKSQSNVLGGIIFGGFFGLFFIGSLFLMHSGPAVVTIQNSGFSPNISQIPDTTIGSTVTWINNDTKPHRIVSDYGWFDSGKLSPGQNYSHNFYGNKLGSYPYHDSMNQSLKGDVLLYIPDGEG